MAQENGSTVVIDIGSGFIKAGIASENIPSSILPTIIGKSKLEFNKAEKDIYFGHQANEKRGILNIMNPVNKGQITNWKSMEQFFQFIFQYELKSDSDSNSLILSCYPKDKPFIK